MSFFLKRLLLLLVIAYISQFVLFKVSKSILDKKSEFRLTRFFRSPRHANFILGNSRAVNSVNEKYAVEKLNIDVINLGFNGMPYKNLKTILDAVNNKNTNATIFVEITALLNEINDDSYAYYISNSPEIKLQYQKTVFEKLQLLRLNNEIFLRNIYYLRKSDNDWINRYSISPALIKEIRGNNKPVSIFPDQKELINRIFQIKKDSEAHHNKVVFFLAPYYPDYLSKITDYKEVCDYLYSLKPQIIFYDLNLQSLPPSSFADRLHTNVDGAIPLTEYLLKTIRN